MCTYITSAAGAVTEGLGMTVAEAVEVLMRLGRMRIDSPTAR